MTSRVMFLCLAASIVAFGCGDDPSRPEPGVSFFVTSAEDARDRIGSGPWYNAAGALVANSPDDLHAGNRFRQRNTTS